MFWNVAPERRQPGYVVFPASRAPPGRGGSRFHLVINNPPPPTPSWMKSPPTSGPAEAPPPPVRAALAAEAN